MVSFCGPFGRRRCPTSLHADFRSRHYYSLVMTSSSTPRRVGLRSPMVVATLFHLDFREVALIVKNQIDVWTPQFVITFYLDVIPMLTVKQTLFRGPPLLQCLR